MAQTNLMRADEIAAGFNTVEDRKYWRASVAGSRVNPEVHFNSRSSMVQVAYHISTSEFTVTFSRTAAAFGDFMASAYRSMAQILSSLKAAGLPFAEVLGDDAVLWAEYNPRTKETVINIVRHGDTWASVVPTVFKVPARKSLETEQSPIDVV